MKPLQEETVQALMRRTELAAHIMIFSDVSLITVSSAMLHRIACVHTTMSEPATQLRARTPRRQDTAEGASPCLRKRDACLGGLDTDPNPREGSLLDRNLSRPSSTQTDAIADADADGENRHRQRTDTDSEKDREEHDAQTHKDTRIPRVNVPAPLTYVRPQHPLQNQLTQSTTSMSPRKTTAPRSAGR